MTRECGCDDRWCRTRTFIPNATWTACIRKAVFEHIAVHEVLGLSKCHVQIVESCICHLIAGIHATHGTITSIWESVAGLLQWLPNIWTEVKEPYVTEYVVLVMIDACCYTTVITPSACHIHAELVVRIGHTVTGLWLFGRYCEFTPRVYQSEMSLWLYMDR